VATRHPGGRLGTRTARQQGGARSPFCYRRSAERRRHAKGSLERATRADAGREVPELDAAVAAQFLAPEPENGIGIVATGGRIRITTDHFFQLPGSVVSATSANPELSGTVEIHTVEIHSPDVNLAGTLAELPSSFLDAASLDGETAVADVRRRIDGRLRSGE
jgi:hypothetical protein